MKVSFPIPVAQLDSLRWALGSRFQLEFNFQSSGLSFSVIGGNKALWYLLWWQPISCGRLQLKFLNSYKQILVTC